MQTAMSVPISLITTGYNRDRYLAIAIESVLKQTYQNFELLLWDDGSTDRSIEIATHYAQQDKRIRVIAAKRQGRSVALTCAIAQTTGKYMGLVDSDDALSPAALAETIAVLETNPAMGMVYTNYRVMDESGQVKGDGSRCKIPYSKARLLVDFMTFHFRLIRRSVYDQIGGFDPSFICAQDYDLCLKISEVSEIIHLPKPLYYYRSHSNSISHQQQIEQILWTKQAIENALERRGLANKFELDVQITSQYSLKLKQ